MSAHRIDWLGIMFLIVWAVGAVQGFMYGWLFSDIWNRDGMKAAFLWLVKRKKAAAK